MSFDFNEVAQKSIEKTKKDNQNKKNTVNIDSEKILGMDVSMVKAIVKSTPLKWKLLILYAVICVIFSTIYFVYNLFCLLGYELFLALIVLLLVNFVKRFAFKRRSIGLKNSNKKKQQYNKNYK